MSASFSRLCHCDLLLRCNCPLCCVVVVPNSAHILKVSSSSAMFHTVWSRGQAAEPSWGGWYLRAPILWCGDECVFLYLVSFEAASAHTRLRLAAHLSLNNIKASPISRICWIVKCVGGEMLTERGGSSPAPAGHTWPPLGDTADGMAGEQVISLHWI